MLHNIYWIVSNKFIKDHPINSIIYWKQKFIRQFNFTEVKLCNLEILESFLGQSYSFHEKNLTNR